MRTDESGEFWNIVIGAAVGGVMEIASQMITGTKLKDINWRSVAVEGVLGAVSSLGIPARITSKLGKVAFTAFKDVVIPTAVEVRSQIKTNKRVNYTKTAITASQASINSAVTAGTDRLLKSTSSRMAKAVVHSTRQLFFFTFGLISKFWR